MARQPTHSPEPPERLIVDADDRERLHGEALEHARLAHPELAPGRIEPEVDAAFELALGVARDERELLRAFDAELTRALEEQAVLGAPDSVLPSSSTPGATLFAQPEAATAEPVPATTDDGDPTGRQSSHEADEPASGAAPEGSANARATTDAKAEPWDVCVAATARRLAKQSPAEIQQAMGLDRRRYWFAVGGLLGYVDTHLLTKQHASHVDRRSLIRLIAGLQPAEKAFALERHLRECTACAAYFVDLVEATSAITETADLDAVPADAAAPSEAPAVTQTQPATAAEASQAGPESAPRHQFERIRVHADDLAKYAPPPERRPSEREEAGATAGRRRRSRHSAQPAAAGSARRTRRTVRGGGSGTARRPLGGRLGSAAVLAVLLASGSFALGSGLRSDGSSTSATAGERGTNGDRIGDGQTRPASFSDASDARRARRSQSRSDAPRRSARRPAKRRRSAPTSRSAGVTATPSRTGESRLGATLPEDVGIASPNDAPLLPIPRRDPG